MANVIRLLIAVAGLGLMASGVEGRSAQTRTDNPSGETEWVDIRQSTAGPRSLDLRLPPPGPSWPSTMMPEPVDQAVGDLDPLAGSFRVVEPGHARFPDHARMQRLHDDAPGMWSRMGQPSIDRFQRDRRHAYRYQAPGVQAWIRQPTYIVRDDISGMRYAINHAPRRDGEHRELIPADTVFDLIPPSRRPSLAPLIEQDESSDGRMDGRIDSRIDTRID